MWHARVQSWDHVCPRVLALHVIAREPLHVPHVTPHSSLSPQIKSPPNSNSKSNISLSHGSSLRLISKSHKPKTATQITHWFHGWFYIRILLMCALRHILIFIFEKKISRIKKVMTVFSIPKKIFLKIKNLMCALLTEPYILLWP